METAVRLRGTTVARRPGDDGSLVPACGRQAGMETTATMPKMKTHSGTAKRFRLTGTGKVMRRRANRGHLFEHKSSRLTRRLAGEVTVAPSDVKEIKKLLGK